MMSAPDCDALVLAVRAGNADAYDEIVRLHQVALRAFLATYCPNWEIVDDLAQQTFMWAYEHLDEYTPGTRFQSWLKAIARNTLLAELKSKQRHSGRYRKYAEFVVTTSEQTELEKVDVEEDGLPAVLGQCLQKLPDDARQLLKWRYQDDIATRELAEKVQKSETALRGSLFRIRQMLKRCVEQQGKLSVDSEWAAGTECGT
jgi:RNA polymerase sigma-70 factor (ECF subfamily)